MSITTREFSRTAAAFGAVLALTALALPVTPAAAVATAQSAAEAEGPSPAPSPPSAAEDSATADSAAAVSADHDGSEDSVGAADDNGNAIGIGDDGTAAGEGAAADGAEADADESPGREPDPRCAAGSAEPGKPCATAEPLTATYDKSTKHLNLDPAQMPESWVGEKFDGPRPTVVAYSDQPSQAQANSTETDDSGHPITSAAAVRKYSLDRDGSIRDISNPKRPKKATFAEDPHWKIGSNGDKLLVNPNDDSGPDGSANDRASANKDGSVTDANSETKADSRVPGTEESSADTDTGGSADDSGATTSAKQDSTTSADTDATTSGSSQANASTDGTTRASGTADSGAETNDETDSDEDSDSESGTGPGNDGPDGGRTTEDPATGNGAGNGRDVIPGDAGNEWRPSSTSDAPRPDYSDPVPRNPDVPSPEEDTDLITGGDKPEPRGNNQAISAFGESIVSTMVSSWPVFVLAACGMAAVGFILFLVGRRNRQEE